MKRDIAPREAEINDLKVSTQEMDADLKNSNAANVGLGFTVDDLRNRQDEIQQTIIKTRARIRKNESYIQGFKNAVYWVVQYIDDHDQLKKSIQSSLYGYVKDSKIKNVDIDPDIKKEYTNQKKYLESSHHSLQKRLEKEDQIHRQDNQNVMQENVNLIAEIGNLRKKVQEAHNEWKKQKNNMKKDGSKDTHASKVESQ